MTCAVPPVSLTSLSVMSFAIVASDWSTVVTPVLPVSTSKETIGIFAAIAAATGALS